MAGCDTFFWLYWDNFLAVSGWLGHFFGSLYWDTFLGHFFWTLFWVTLGKPSRKKSAVFLTLFKLPFLFAFHSFQYLCSHLIRISFSMTFYLLSVPPSVALYANINSMLLPFSDLLKRPIFS